MLARAVEQLRQLFLGEKSRGVPSALMLQQAVEAVNFDQTYQIAHKIKPTIELFGIKDYTALLEIQDWGKLNQKDKVITPQLDVFIHSVNKALSEIKTNFNL